MVFPEEHASIPDNFRTSLIGKSTDGPTESIRTAINAHPGSVERLRELLYQPEMIGVGYSEFIDRACAMAEEQIKYVRAHERARRDLDLEPKRCYCGKTEQECITGNGEGCHYPDATRHM